MKSHLCGAALNFGVDPSGTNREWGMCFPPFPPAPPWPSAPSPALANLPLTDLSTSDCQGSCPRYSHFIGGKWEGAAALETHQGTTAGHGSSTPRCPLGAPCPRGVARPVFGGVWGAAQVQTSPLPVWKLSPQEKTSLGVFAPVPHRGSPRRQGPAGPPPSGGTEGLSP